jgi:hypothetical protein
MSAGVYNKQLFIGKLSSVQPLYDNVIAINGDTISGVAQITNVAAFNSTFDTSLLRIGQVIQTLGTGFASDVTITNIAGSTLTVSATSNASQTGGIFTADMPAGTYFINSASFSDPQNVLTVNDITGSDDSDYDAALTPKYAIVGSATSTLGGSVITGKFHLYEISEVTYRDVGTAGISAFVKWGEQGSESDSGDFLAATSGQTIAIGAMSATQSQVTIYGDDIILGTPAGMDLAGYQVTLPELIDQAQTSSAGVTFPFTGSAAISGSIGLTGSQRNLITTNESFLIANPTSVTQSYFKIEDSGVATFRARINAADGGEPTAVAGGLYFTTSSAFIGVE